MKIVIKFFFCVVFFFFKVKNKNTRVLLGIRVSKKKLVLGTRVLKKRSYVCKHFILDFCHLIYKISFRGAPNIHNFRGDKLTLGGVKSVILYIKFMSSYKICKKKFALGGDMSPPVPPSRAWLISLIYSVDLLSV